MFSKADLRLETRFSRTANISEELEFVTLPDHLKTIYVPEKGGAQDDVYDKPSPARDSRRKHNVAMQQALSPATERGLRPQPVSASSASDAHCRVYSDAFLQV